MKSYCAKPHNSQPVMPDLIRHPFYSLNSRCSKAFLFAFVITLSIFIFSSQVQAITISGSDTITASGSATYTASGCSGTVTWGVTNPGASINQNGILTTSNACGTVLVAARCSGDGVIATKDVRTDGGQWVSLSGEFMPEYCACLGVSCEYWYNLCEYTSGKNLYQYTAAPAYCSYNNPATCSPDSITNPIPCSNPPASCPQPHLIRSWRNISEWRCTSSSSCAYNITPAAEVCNDLKDNNCNGQVDENCPGIQKTEGDLGNQGEEPCP